MFSTGNTYAGQYEVYAELLDGDGKVLDYALAPFVIASSSATGGSVSASISTERYEYQPLQIVTLNDRIMNITSNAVTEGLTAITTVYRPDGSEFWSESQTVRQLLAGGSQDIVYQLQLHDAMAGQYRVQLLVKDSQNTVQAESEAAFVVLSTADTGVGISGSVSAMPNPVFRTEPLSIYAQVVNDGNDSLLALPVTLTLVDPASQQELGRWHEGD